MRQNVTMHASPVSRARRVLLLANLAMIAMVVIHDADHVRQAARWCYTISLQLWLVNIAVYGPSLVALFMLWRRSSAAAVATSLNGLFVAAAFAEVHLWRPSIPIWGIWNDNFFILGVDRISWAILAFTVLVGVCVAMAGAYAMGLYWAELRTGNGRSGGESR